ncbi:hypothetical protein D9M69_587430 [compost metagenome]
MRSVELLLRGRRQAQAGVHHLVGVGYLSDSPHTRSERTEREIAGNRLAGGRHALVQQVEVLLHLLKRFVRVVLAVDDELRRNLAGHQLSSLRIFRYTSGLALAARAVINASR